MKHFIRHAALLKQLFLICIFLISGNFIYAQPAFTLNVSAVPETCPGNGTLNFSVNGTDPAATVTYKIWRTSAPAQTESAALTTSAQTLSGLSAGVYQVKAVQTLGANSNSQEQGITIANNQQPLEFNLVQSPSICPNTGMITVNITNGTANKFSIISGPVTRPEQPGNVFSALPAGSYLVKVTDMNCPGTARTKSITITGPVNTFSIVEQKWLNETPATYCDSTLPRYYNITLGNVAPYTFEWIYTRPGASVPDTVTRQYSATNTNFTIRFPYVYNTAYNVTLRVRNACGTQVHNSSFTVPGHRISHDWSIGVRVPPVTCSGSNGYIRISPANWHGNYIINFTNYPAGFDPLLYNPNHPGPFTGPADYGSAANLPPTGSYTFTITDACGNSETFTQPLGPEPGFALTASDASEGCGPDVATRVAYITSGKVSKVLVKYVYGNNGLQSSPQAAILRTAFANMYGVTLSGGNFYDATAHLNPAGTRFFMDFPTGGANGVSPNNGIGYFRVTFYNACGDSIDVDWRAKGYIPNNNVTVNQGCTSFDITTPPVKVINSYTYYPQGWLPYGPSNQPNYYYLQKLDPVTGNWVHPTTGVVYNEAIDNLQNAGQLLPNDATTANLTYTGTFRVVFRHYTYQNMAVPGYASAAPMRPCVSVLKEFTIDPKVSFSSFMFGCAGNQVSLVVDASSSLAPLTYALLTKNGTPYVVNNGTNPVFTGLDPATYEVQVTDNCSNSFTQLLDATYVVEPAIIPENLCEGNTGASLSITNIPGLTYEWFNNDNPSVILSNSSVLTFAPAFSYAAHAGTYTVRLSGITGCAPKEISYTIPATQTPPNPGQGLTKSICGTDKGTLNLFTLLAGNYDTYGTWRELSNSGINLNGYYWNNTNVADGNYVFEYTVPGSSCQPEATTLAIVELANTCPQPLPSHITSFTAVENACSVEINWTTTKETDHAYFELEHSVNGLQWETLSRIAAGLQMATGGNKYSYTHTEVPKGQHFYRLQQVDMGNTKGTYSHIVQAYVQCKGRAAKLYPNPATETVYLSNITESGIVTLYNTLGQVIKSTAAVPVNNKISVAVNELPAGIYIIKYQGANGTIHNYKMTKQ